MNQINTIKSGTILSLHTQTIPSTQQKPPTRTQPALPKQRSPQTKNNQCPIAPRQPKRHGTKAQATLLDRTKIIAASQAPPQHISTVRRAQQKKMDLQGIEPWTTPMLREYYTTKPQARAVTLLEALME
jgi:hypothetical protein